MPDAAQCSVDVHVNPLVSAKIRQSKRTGQRFRAVATDIERCAFQLEPHPAAAGRQQLEPPRVDVCTVVLRCHVRNELVLDVREVVGEVDAFLRQRDDRVRGSCDLAEQDVVGLDLFGVARE